MYAKEFTNNHGGKRFKSLRSAFVHFRFYFSGDRPLDSYIRARRAIIGQSGLYYCALQGQAPGRASFHLIIPNLPE